MNRSVAPLVAFAALALVGAAASTVGAQPIVSGPAVTLDQEEAAPGGRIVVTVDGFTARNLTITVCGNEARRGSADCDMTTSRQIRVEEDGSPTWTRFVVPAPAVPCPCVVRVTSPQTDEIAVAPIVVTGHPVGPVLDPPNVGDLLDVAVTAEANADGVFYAVRSSLGGPTAYDVTVTVRNVGLSVLRSVELSIDGFRGDNALPPIEIDQPGLIAVGQTWRQTVSVRVPTPSFGEVQWRATASGAGRPVTAEATSYHRPVLLIVLVILLVLDVGLLAIRFTIRRRVARQAEAATATGAASVTAGEQDATSTPRDLVGASNRD